MDWLRIRKFTNSESADDYDLFNKDVDVDNHISKGLQCVRYIILRNMTFVCICIFLTDYHCSYVNYS